MAERACPALRTTSTTPPKKKKTKNTFAWLAANVAMTRKVNDVSPLTGAPRGRKRPRSHPSNASYLKHLDLTDSDEITNVGLESVALLRNLQYPDLRGCDGIADKKGIDECGATFNKVLSVSAFLRCNSFDSCSCQEESEIQALSTLPHFSD